MLKTKEATHVSQIDLFPTILELAGVESDGHNDHSAATSFAGALRNGVFDKDDAVFMEQEETRAIRTPEWLYKRRFQLAPKRRVELLTVGERQQIELLRLIHCESSVLILDDMSPLEEIKVAASSTSSPSMLRSVNSE